MRSRLNKVLIKATIILLLLVFFWQASFLVNFKNSPEFGVTFSAQQATDLGLAWKPVYLLTLDDLKVKKLRLPVYWDQVQKDRGVYDFGDLDWQVEEAEKRNLKIILAIGQRVPRWPECHRPEWVQTETKEMQNVELLKYIKVLVNRYKNYSSVEMWQIENEPFLNVFGDCPIGDKSLLVQEIALVKSLDAKHPVVITDSGELSSWYRTAKLGDYFGFSVYRSVDSWMGDLSYNHIIPPLFYRAKAWFIKKPIEKVFVSELQAEPWTKKQMIDTPVAEQEKSLDFKKFESNIEFSKSLGIPRVYLWGVEWWYWKKLHGDPSFWTKAKTLF